MGDIGLAMKLDVSSESEVRARFSEASAELGHLWALVHSAGILQVEPALDMGAGAWREVLEVNLTGTFLCDQAAARHYGRGHGRRAHSQHRLSPRPGSRLGAWPPMTPARGESGCSLGTWLSSLHHMG